MEAELIGKLRGIRSESNLAASSAACASAAVIYHHTHQDSPGSDVFVGVRDVCFEAQAVAVAEGEALASRSDLSLAREHCDIFLRALKVGLSLQMPSLHYLYAVGLKLSALLKGKGGTIDVSSAVLNKRRHVPAAYEKGARFRC